MHALIRIIAVIAPINGLHKLEILDGHPQLVHQNEHVRRPSSVCQLISRLNPRSADWSAVHLAQVPKHLRSLYVGLPLTLGTKVSSGDSGTPPGLLPSSWKNGVTVRSRPVVGDEYHQEDPIAKGLTYYPGMFALRERRLG